MADYSLQALHDEIEADPLALGYKEGGGEWKGDEVIADLINTKNYTMSHEVVQVGDIRAVTTFNALDGLTASETDWFTWLTNSGEIQVQDHLLSDLAGIPGPSRWAVGDRPTMEPALAAILQFTGSRAEVLWGEGQTISVGDVGRAANL